MKELGQSGNKSVQDKENIPEWERRFRKEMDADPRLKGCYERLMQELSVPAASDDEVREYYEQLLDAKLRGESIHADWHNIIKWLEEHPKGNSNV